MLKERSPIDNKYLAEYYVENNAVVSDIFNTWDKDDRHFSDDIKKDSKELKASNVIMKYVDVLQLTIV